MDTIVVGPTDGAHPLSFQKRKHIRWAWRTRPGPPSPPRATAPGARRPPAASARTRTSCSLHPHARTKKQHETPSSSTTRDSNQSINQIPPIHTAITPSATSASPRPAAATCSTSPTRTTSTVAACGPSSRCVRLRNERHAIRNTDGTHTHMNKTYRHAHTTCMH